MKKPVKLYANSAIALCVGVLIPVSLILSIPVFFKSERVQKEEKPPIILQMMALQLPQQKSLKKKPIEKIKPKAKPVKKPEPIKPKTVQKKPVPKLVKKIPKKTMIANAKPEIKEIPQPKQQQTKPELPMPVPIFKLTQAPHFLHKQDLVYPEVMRSSGITGIVKLAVLIDKEGKVHRVTVLKSAGKAFDEAAKKALLASTFMPAKVGNKKVAVELRIPVKFRLL